MSEISKLSDKSVAIGTLPTCDGAQLGHQVDHAGLAAADVLLLGLGHQQRLGQVLDGLLVLL